MNKDGYVVPVKLLLKILPNLDEGVNNILYKIYFIIKYLF